MCNDLPWKKNETVTIIWNMWIFGEKSSRVFFGANVKALQGAWQFAFVVFPALFCKYSGTWRETYSVLLVVSTRSNFARQPMTLKKDTNKEFFQTKNKFTSSLVESESSLEKLYQMHRNCNLKWLLRKNFNRKSAFVSVFNCASTLTARRIVFIFLARCWII